MKKIKYFGSILAVGLAAVTTPIAITSCGGGKQQQGGIDIKSNPNIKIECSEIVVGKELTIKYTLDTDFGFDLAQSTITFGDSNGVVTLLECDVDRDAKQIIVPAKYVTSTNVKIDIKAESGKTVEVTEAQYNAAIKNISEYSDTRSFTMDGDVLFKEYDMQEKEILSQTGGLTVRADGYTDHMYQYINVNEERSMEELWGEKDPKVGCWQYAKSDEIEGVIKAPAPKSFASWYMTEMFKTFPQFSEYKWDSLYNAYYSEWTTPQNAQWVAALKFNTDHKLSGLAFAYSQINTFSHTTEVMSYSSAIDYAKPTITIPTATETRSEMVYEDASEYKYVTDHLEVPLHDRTFFARLAIPMSKMTNYTNTKDLIITLDKTPDVSDCEACVRVGNAELTSNQFTWDKSNYKITINSSALPASFTSADRIYVMVGPSGATSIGMRETPTKFVISQQ